MKPLTKSRFKIGLECPNKLYFTSKKHFVNNALEDPFLLALATFIYQISIAARSGRAASGGRKALTDKGFVLIVVYSP